MLPKVLVTATIIMQEVNNVAQGQKSTGQVILAFLLYVVAPICVAYGVVRGGMVIIQRHEVDKGLAAIGGSIIIGLLPLMLKNWYNIDLANSLAKLFTLGG
jgi:hypothetical protein